ncbi:MAG: DUF5119 domain-containing protein [Muribaculaceae bacterium]|nr:DUF5119 domain-containing protein [Muribaculaceae bacterium]
MKTLRYIFPALAISAMSLTSCLHKDLDTELYHRVNVNVIFDWQNAPDANPTSMLTYFYHEGDDALVFTFPGGEGGEVSIPSGTYNGVSLNGDISDWASMRNMDDPESFEIYTKNAEQLEGYGLSSRSLPRAEGAENERMAMTPKMLWSDRSDNIDIPAYSDKDIYITFTPCDNLCRYTVDILHVNNMEYLHGASVDATLSGMAESALIGKGETGETPVTMPFLLTPDSSAKSLHSEYLTFGECNTNKVPHYLTVYLYLTDGTKWYKTFDVTGQVTDAPDPKNVHIVIDGLELPKPITGSGGFVPDVNEWNDIRIDIPM